MRSSPHLIVFLAFGCLLLWSPRAALAQDAGYRYVTEWGTEGAGAGQFDKPFCIAVDDDGFVYVSDGGNDRIQKFTSDGTYLARWGSEGTGDGQFDRPRGVAADNLGYVYVVDRSNHRIQKFTTYGVHVWTQGGPGEDPSQFMNPEGIAVAPLDLRDLYVADFSHNRIKKWSRSGVYLDQWGSSGSGDGAFDRPRGIAVDAGGNVYCSDHGNDRIQKFATDGTYLGQWGSAGSQLGQFQGPGGVAVDADGNVLVADAYNHRIQKFTGAGAFIYAWGTWGEGHYSFKTPRDVALDENGFVYVVELGGDCVKKYRPNHRPSAPTECLIAPTAPTSADDLVATASGSTDPDGDPVTYSYQWRKRIQIGSTWLWGPWGHDGGTLDHSEIARGQSWQARARACDGCACSNNWRTSAPVTILNAPPSTPTNCVTWPDDPLSWETLLTEAAGSTDPEGDAVTYEYQWRKKDSAGASWGAWGYDGHLLDTSETAKGQIWQARGRACDDLDCSGWCKSVTVTIQNSPPSVPGNCLIAPSDPRTTDDLTATTSGSSDWDADPVTYEYQWRKKDNVTAPWGPFGYDGQTLDHSETAKGQIWHARVRAYDGEAYSDGWRTAPIAFTILNTPPSITGVTISPVNPTTYDDLTATPQGWSDPDADAPGYVWHWQEEETGWTDIPGGTSATLGHENFQPGDHIRVVCTPHDGEQSGEARRRAVTIWIGPTLSWLGGPGYVTDAVHPDRDRHMEWFTFKLRYQGVAVAFVRLHLFRYGVEVAGSPYDMNPGSGDPVTGQTFWFKRRLCKGTYAYYFTASDGAQQAAGPPTRERIGPISHNRPPRLEWAGYGAWEWDPVDRQGRNMPHTQFTWKVKYIDREGDPPEYVRLRLARRSMVGGSPVDEELAASPFEMVAESTDYMNGAVFTYTRQLHAESRYVCWFEAREVAPAPFTSNDAYGVPTWWRRNMVWIFNAPPRLRWAPGANFRGDDPPDGLHPNRGNVGDTFTFKVQYRDPEGVEPAYVRLHLLRWNGSDYVEVGASPFEMSTMGTSFDIANYSVAVQRNQPGRYRYYFSANDGLRDAIGEPSWHRMPGPTVNAAHSASAQITSVSCCPAAGGAQVTFTLSAEACVTAEVLNIAGRVVRVLTADRTMPPGVNALTWNGRDSGGLGVPSGAYLVRMKVVDTAGANVQLVAPVRIAR